MMFTHAMPYTFAIVVVLAITLYITVRTDGWLPSFRMLRIRRALVLLLLAWGLTVLLAPLHAKEKAPTLPVVHRWDKAVVPAPLMRKNTSPQGTPVDALYPWQSSA